jgi:uncharacterized protein DUF5818
MRKTLLFALFLLLCAGWMVAQETSGSQSTKSANESTIQGCLSGSAGGYMLADQSGNTYRLAGDTSKLSAHVGHEVRVTGTESSAASSGSQAGTRTGATTAEAKAQFNVTKVEHVASTCSPAQK